VLRVDTVGCPEQAALVDVSPDGRTTSFDARTGFVDFPGGAKKFTIRYDAPSKLYWSLATIVPERHQGGSKPGGVRNTLALTCSPDLRTWTVRCLLLYHPDVARHGFQYVDWVFDGDDIIAACRTAYDDGLGGAHNNHDANFLTFHRIKKFRAQTMADSVPLVGPPEVKVDLPKLTITGHGWELATLADGQQAFTNRQYTWQNVPAQFRDWKITRIAGGESADVRARSKTAGVVYLATSASRPTADLPGWEPVAESTFNYSDRGKSKLKVYRRAAKAGQDVLLPQGPWSGGLLLVEP